MEYQIEIRNTTKILHLIGSMDVHSIHKIEKAFLLEIQKNDADTIVLDLGDVPFISSSGLRILVAALKYTTEQEKSLYLTNLRPAVEKVFEIVDLNTMFSIRKSVEELIF